MGPRGVVLHELTVSFEAQARAAEWKSLVQQLRFDPDECVHGLSATFVAFPQKLEELSPYLMGEVRLGTQNPKKSFWTFEWARAPDKHPPKELVAHSKAAGSFPKILRQLEQLWPTSAPLKMAVAATYFIETDEWDVDLPSINLGGPKAGRQSPRLVPTHWRIEPRVGIVDEVILDPKSEEDFVFLMGKGSYTQKWTSQFLNEVDGAVWSGLKTVLKRR